MSTTIIICGIISTEAKCTLDNINFYPEGAYWNPVQDTQKIGAGCVNCTCSNKTISCSKQDCPILDCEVPRYPVGACCPVCEDLTNIIPTVAPVDEGEAGDKDRKCEFEGRIYEHNQFFSNNNTHITPTRSNQCVNCICQSGQIYCYLKTCDITPGCSKFYQSPDTCCPVCVDSKTKGKNLQKKKPEDCTDGYGKLKANSTSWHPYVAEKIDNCITCTCLNGAVTCERLKGKCEKTKDDNEDSKKNRKKIKKKKKKGLCKKKSRKNRKNKKKNRKTPRNGRSKRKGKRRRKNKRRQRKRSKNCVKVQHNVTMSDKLCPALPALSSPPDGALSCHYNNLCLPARTEYIIYRKQISNGSNGDGTLIIAFDHVKTQTVEIWTYVINKDKIKERQELAKCPSPSLRAQLKTPDAILGAASAKSVKDFQRKLRRGLKGCEQKKKGCRLRTVRRHVICFELEEIDVPKCQN